MDLVCSINPINAELNPIHHLLALAGAHHFVHFNRVSVKSVSTHANYSCLSHDPHILCINIIKCLFFCYGDALMWAGLAQLV